MASEVTFSGDEVACIKRLAELFEQGTTELDGRNTFDTVKSLGLAPEKRDAILATMEHFGIITEVTNAVAIKYIWFKISPSAVQVVRKIEADAEKAKEPGDIVEQMKSTAKSNRALAWIIIGFVVLTAAVTFINQVLGLLREIGLRN